MEWGGGGTGKFCFSHQKNRPTMVFVAQANVHILVPSPLPSSLSDVTKQFPFPNHPLPPPPPPTTPAHGMGVASVCPTRHVQGAPHLNKIIMMLLMLLLLQLGALRHPVCVCVRGSWHGYHLTQLTNKPRGIVLQRFGRGPIER